MGGWITRDVLFMFHHCVVVHQPLITWITLTLESGRNHDVNDDDEFEQEYALKKCVCIPCFKGSLHITHV